MVSSYLSEHTVPLIIGITFCILMYIDSVINSVVRKGRDYLKGFLVLFTLSYISIYMYNNLGSSTITMSGGSSFYKSPHIVRDEIFIGNPNF